MSVKKFGGPFENASSIARPHNLLFKKTFLPDDINDGSVL
jgi:hypothetical protein